MKSGTGVLVNTVSLFGMLSLVSVVYSIVYFRDSTYYVDTTILSVAFALMARWSVRLPSGSTWRPAMTVTLVGLLMVPPPLSLLVALPGLLLIAMKDKNRVKSCILSVGHVALGLYIGGVLFRILNLDGVLSLKDPLLLLSMISGLLVHLIVNRLISAVIVTSRVERTFKEQLSLTLREINWSYFNTYMMAIIIAVMYKQNGIGGLLLSIGLLAGIFRATKYFTRVQDLERMVNLDPLTGVENRSAWEAFDRSVQSKPMTGTIALLDLNDFKKVNDSLGHLEGDRILREFAGHLRTHLRNIDRVFRYGGDEFILFVPHEPGMEPMVEKRIGRMAEDISEQWKRKGMPVGASIGYASYPRDGEQLKELLKIADERMYRSKQRNKTLDSRVRREAEIQK